MIGCRRAQGWIDPNESSEVSGANSRQNVRKLIKDGFIVAKPNVIHSKSRHQRFMAAKAKGRHTSFGNRKGSANARMPFKVLWMRRLRHLGRLLSKYSDAKEIDKHLYRELYANSKGNKFKNKRVLMGTINFKVDVSRSQKKLVEQAAAKKIKVNKGVSLNIKNSNIEPHFRSGSAPAHSAALGVQRWAPDSPAVSGQNDGADTTYCTEKTLYSNTYTTNNNYPTPYYPFLTPPTTLPTTPVQLQKESRTRLSAMLDGSDTEDGNGGGTSESQAEAPITLKVRDQSGEEMFFKVEKGTAMQKIMQAFADRKGVGLDVLRFTIDGERVNAEDTPKMLEMEDGDQIDVLLHQRGGGDHSDADRDDGAKADKDAEAVQEVVEALARRVAIAHIFPAMEQSTTHLPATVVSIIESFLDITQMENEQDHEQTPAGAVSAVNDDSDFSAGAELPFRRAVPIDQMDCMCDLTFATNTSGMLSFAQSPAKADDAPRDTNTNADNNTTNTNNNNSLSISNSATDLSIAPPPPATSLKALSPVTDSIRAYPTTYYHHHSLHHHSPHHQHTPLVGACGDISGVAEAHEDACELSESFACNLSEWPSSPLQASDMVSVGGRDRDRDTSSASSAGGEVEATEGPSTSADDLELCKVSADGGGNINSSSRDLSPVSPAVLPGAAERSADPEKTAISAVCMVEPDLLEVTQELPSTMEVCPHQDGVVEEGNNHTMTSTIGIVSHDPKSGDALDPVVDGEGERQVSPKQPTQHEVEEDDVLCHQQRHYNARGEDEAIKHTLSHPNSASETFENKDGVEETAKEAAEEADDSHDLTSHMTCHATGISTSMASSDGNSVEGGKKGETGLNKAEATEEDAAMRVERRAKPA